MIHFNITGVRAACGGKVLASGDSSNSFKDVSCPECQTWLTNNLLKGFGKPEEWKSTDSPKTAIPLSPKERMQKLQQLLEQMIVCQEKFESLDNQAKQAKTAYDKAKVKFNCMREDLIGDLFNGCFGEEWLLREVL